MIWADIWQDHFALWPSAQPVDFMFKPTNCHRFKPTNVTDAIIQTPLASITENREHDKTPEADY